MKRIKIKIGHKYSDLDYIYNYISKISYWGKGRSLSDQLKANLNSICINAFHNEKQIGFARIVTDQVTFAYLCDVFVDEDFQSQGIGQYMLEYILADDRFISIRRFILATRDAHKLYEKFGFIDVKNDQTLMQRKHL